MNVVTNSMDAEQGLAGGAAVNVQTRSGTNAIHGSGFDYHTEPAPQSLADAVRRCRAEYREEAETELQRVRRAPSAARSEKNKAFYFVSYESIRDHKTVDNTVSVPLPAMLRGDLSLSPTPIYDPLSGNPDGTGRTQFQVFPGDRELRAVQHGHQPELPEHHSCGADGSDREEDRGLHPGQQHRPGNATTISCRARSRSTASRSIRRWTTTSIPSSTWPGTFGMLHYRTNVPTVFGDTAVGEPIGGSSNPGQGHGNTYRVTVMGTYIFSPTFLMDAHYRMGAAGNRSEQPGLGPNVGLDVLGIPGTNGTRAFESGWPTFEFARRRLRDGRGERELHALLPPRSAVAVRGEFQLDQEQAQHPVRRRHLPHGAEPGAGRIHHRRLRRAGRIRVRSRHHRALRDGRSASGKLRADLRAARGTTASRPS